jgi:protein-S-isoprenylcysteine O-methyltransferase Ste14
MTSDGRASSFDAMFALGYVGLGGFLAVEALTRQPGAASSIDAGADDEGTTRRIVTAYVAAAGAAPALRLVSAPRLPRSVAIVGLAMQITGLGLRAWSMRVLGQSYSRTLRADVEQRVVDEGPYRLVRHPGYLGSLLVWIGFGLASRHPAVVALVSGLLGDAYRRRIDAEERLLRRDLPGYAEYARRTGALIPNVW